MYSCKEHTHTHTHTRTHARTHTRTHALAYTRTHTHIYCVLCTVCMLTIPCVGRVEGVASEELVLGVGSTELDGVEELGVICNNIADNDASDPRGKHRKQ